MNRGWRWIDKRLLLILHDESLAEHGGASCPCDEGLLDSALARPLNLLAYGSPDAADLAASYGFGLAKKMRSWTATSERPSWRTACSSR